MSKIPQLSEHDQAVLDNLFSAQLGGPQSSIYSDEELPEQLIDDCENDSEDCKLSQKIEIDGISAAASGNLKSAIELFTNAINQAPFRASPYNNRAQAYRLMRNDDAALNDLNKVLRLTDCKGRTACHALCQRGSLKRKQEDIEGAKEDFSIAAKLGSQFARNQLIEMNPYAALCNQMLAKAFANQNQSD